MKRSESIKELATALCKAQAVVKPAVKDAQNPHLKNRYADLASVWDACREAVTANGIAVVQSPSAIGKMVCVETTLMHASGEWLSEALTLEARDASPQSIGSAITYARRYGLAAMVGVAPEDDDGEAAMSRGHHAGPQERDRRPRREERPQQSRHPAPAPAKEKELDPRTWSKLLNDGVASRVQAFQAENPGAREPVNAFQAARHMLRYAVERGTLVSPGAIKDGEVMRILGEIYAWEDETGRPNYFWMRKELVSYLDAKLAEAREKALQEQRGDGELEAATAGALEPDAGMNG